MQDEISLKYRPFLCKKEEKRPYLFIFFVQKILVFVQKKFILACEFPEQKHACSEMVYSFSP